MKRLPVHFFFLSIFLSLATQLPTNAAIVYSGDLYPANPNDWTGYTDAYIGYTNTSNPGQVEVNGGSGLLSNFAYIGNNSDTSGEMTVSGAGSTWTNAGYLYVGRSGSGTLNIINGGTVSNSSGRIGDWSGSTGVVTVDGTGSTWTNAGDLNIGRYGNGTLNIINGGTVNVTGDTHVGSDYGSNSLINFGNNGGTLTTGSLMTPSAQLFGTGVINTNGIVSDYDLVFNSTHSLTQTLTIGGSGQDRNITVNLDISDSVGDLGVNNGSMTIDGIVVNSRCGYIGRYSGSTGVVTVDDAGSTWTNADDLYVGLYGNGTLNIINGGAVNIAGDTYVSYHYGSTGLINFGDNGGTLTTESLMVSPAQLFGTGVINTNGIVSSDYDIVFDSTHGLVQTLTIGGSGLDRNITVNLDMSDSVGSLGVNNSSMAINGIAVNSQCGYIGYLSGSTGVATVDGTGSTWTNADNLYVGLYGNGTLNITNGGTISNTAGFIGDGSDSTGVVTVDGAGSTWNNAGGLFVGNYGSGTLSITNGGTVSDGYGRIGDWSVSNVVVTVDGAGSTWTNVGGLCVGYYGSGTLSITGGGTVSNGGYGYIGREFGSTSAVTVDGAGSTWTNASDLYVGRSGSGTLSITGGGLVSVGGSLTVDWYNDNNSFIRMSDGGMLALAGDADDSLTAFFDIVEGNDAIQWWDPDASGWNSLTSATMGEDYTLEFFDTGELAGYTLLTVTATEPVAGDANGDGRVDGSDVTILAGNWQVGIGDGQTATWAMGDFNGDGKVDGSDVTILAGNWQCGVSTSAATVPEPNCVILLLSFLAAGLAPAIGQSLLKPNPKR